MQFLFDQLLDKTEQDFNQDIGKAIAEQTR